MSRRPSPPTLAPMAFLTASVPAFTLPGAGLPPWSPIVFGAMLLITLVLVIYQAVRYFRNDRDDRRD